jgi:large subunit ribosomal protein L10
MAKNKNQKEKSIEDLAKVTKTAKSIVFVNFDKLEVAEETKLRKLLRDAGNSYQVVKKTLLRKAFEGSGVTGDLSDLPGMISIASGEDLLSPAREVYGFQQSHKDNVKIVGGVFDGRFVGMEEMMSIATIPAINVLYGQFVNVINSPIQGLVVALKAIADKKEA